MVRAARKPGCPGRVRQGVPGSKAIGQGTRAIVVSAALLCTGIVVIVTAADSFVTGAVSLARIWGVSDAFIGLTIVAIGTSAPELVTTIVSTLRRERDIAIGNLAGLPVTPELIRIDIPVMTLVAII